VRRAHALGPASYLKLPRTKRKQEITLQPTTSQPSTIAPRHRHQLFHQPYAAATAPRDLLLDELQRVRALADLLASTHAVAATDRPAPTDPSGAVLGSVLRWRRQRERALRAEARRLVAEIAGAEAEAGGGGAHAARNQESNGTECGSDSLTDVGSSTTSGSCKLR
jgi:hypothetical protein